VKLLQRRPGDRKERVRASPPRRPLGRRTARHTRAPVEERPRIRTPSLQVIPQPTGHLTIDHRIIPRAGQHHPTAPLLGPPFTLDQFPETLASVRNGEGVMIQIARGS